MHTEQHIQSMLDKVTKLFDATGKCMERDLDACETLEQGVQVKQIYLSYAVAMLDMLAWGCHPDVSQATLSALKTITRRLERNADKADDDD